MTAVLLGDYTLGDAIPGVKDSLDKTGEALTALKGAVDTAAGTLTGAVNDLSNAVNDINDIKDETLAGPINELQGAVDTAQGALNDLLAITDADQYMAEILAQMDKAIALLQTLLPDDYLSEAINAVNSAVDAQQNRLDSALDDLQDLTDVTGEIDAVLDQINGVVNDLQNAANDAIGGIVAYVDQISEMLNSGVFVVSYEGALSSLGSEVDAVLPDTGIGGSTQVAGPLLIVKTSNTATLAALNSAFGL